MPVQHGGPAQGRQGRGFAGVGQVQAAPADLLGLARIYRRAQGLCHELGPQADAQQGPPFAQAAADEFQFADKEGIGRSVVDAHGAAQDDAQIGIAPVPCIRETIRHMAGLYRPARFPEDGRQCPKIFKSQMLQYAAAHGGPPVGSASGAVERHGRSRCSLSYTGNGGRERLAPAMRF